MIRFADTGEVIDTSKVEEQTTLTPTVTAEFYARANQRVVEVVHESTTSDNVQENTA